MKIFSKFRGQSDRYEALILLIEKSLNEIPDEMTKKTNFGPPKISSFKEISQILRKLRTGSDRSVENVSILK